jgi:hypothetical protein
MPVKVVKVRAWSSCYLGVIYIGRTWAGWRATVFYSPFHIGEDGTREDVIVQFIEYWYAPEQAWLRAKALQLIRENDILGCWCKPLACHGDIIAGYLNWKRQEATLW